MHVDGDRLVKITTTRWCPNPPPGNVCLTASWAPGHVRPAAEAEVGADLDGRGEAAPVCVPNVVVVVVGLVGVVAVVEVVLWTTAGVVVVSVGAGAEACVDAVGAVARGDGLDPSGAEVQPATMSAEQSTTRRTILAQDLSPQVTQSDPPGHPRENVPRTAAYPPVTGRHCGEGRATSDHRLR